MEPHLVYCILSAPTFASLFGSARSYASFFGKEAYSFEQRWRNVSSWLTVDRRCATHLKVAEKIKDYITRRLDQVGAGNNKLAIDAKCDVERKLACTAM
jgi:hypothetical protein